MTRLVEDRALLEAFRRGERQALSEVYRAYARSVFGLLARGFGFESQGQRCVFGGYKQAFRLEEAVQEVFVRAFAPGARLAYDGLRPYQNYLFSIARNLVIDRHRRDQREVFLEDISATRGALSPVGVPDEMGTEPDSARGADPEADTEAKELQRLVLDFAEALSPAERAIYQARLVEGQSVEACARALGLSEHRVKRTDRALRKRFFSQMKKHGYFEGFSFRDRGVPRSLLLLLIWTGGVA